MNTRRYRTIENDWAALSVNARGCIVRLFNKQTRTEAIAFPEVAEAWRLILPTGRHTVAFVYGSRQKPAAIEIQRTPEGAQALIIRYTRLNVEGRPTPIQARFSLTLASDSAEVTAQAEIRNEGRFPIDEVEFPVLGGFGGFPENGRRVLNLVMANDMGRFAMDCLHRGLPSTGLESNHFCRAEETAFLTSGTGHWVDGKDGRWIDLWAADQGFYMGCHEQIHQTVGGNFFIKLEKAPKEIPNAPAHVYPKATPRWLRVSAVHVPCLAPGKSWQSPCVTFLPHRGDWHAGADRYAAWRHTTLPARAEPPAWTRRFVGWTEILGKTYLGEVFHDYRQCAERVIRDKRVTGLDLVFYYGHTRIGAEGADYDQSPDPTLGGERGFREMIRRLHRNGIRIMLLDHLHRYVNRDIPEYKRLKLERFAIRDARGAVIASRKWGKETARSCLFLDGPTPTWVDMCPACRPWQDHYWRQLERLIKLGVDGSELDLYSCPGRCHAADHGHPVGADLAPVKEAFMREVRARAKTLNPDFILLGETNCVDSLAVLDGFYVNSRYLTEDQRIYRYLFPEPTLQAALVGNYAYDQVNKALMLGIGVETEIDGLRSTTLDACPELARYIGEVNRFRRRHADLLIQGRYRDTVGATVRGDVAFSVLAGRDGGRALILRNRTDRPQRVRAVFPAQRWTSEKPLRDQPLLVWKPFARERPARLPVDIVLKPWEAAVVLEIIQPSRWA